MTKYKIMFSPTGGTKKVLDIMTDYWNDDVVEIDLCDPNFDFSSVKPGPEDSVMIAVPSFGGRAPECAMERLSQIQADKTPTVLITVYGNRAYEDTLLELKTTAEKAGFMPLAAVAAVAQHSIVPKFGEGRPDAEDRKELLDFCEKIQAARIIGIPHFLKVPGTYPYKEFKGLSFHPAAGKECTKCGLCARSCPVVAIPEDDPSQTDRKACITCMRCVSICPVQARGLSRLEKFVAETGLKKACSGRKPNELFL